ncbi:pirin family protein [Limobrevibacterium gyesilva]|uniref:Pirin family protein n=1 Tax=Limobrevibacterium gyesilva TaxID=2991712 RepID=A0AA42CEP7_9PROT|nr:pirin family protein [Limobrevibacterium gyesilva]MCW3473806.1 pirin family protein [Limobrevibacterium gyesilva]
MSWLPVADPDSPGQVDLVVEPSTKDLGDGFRVRRALPSVKRRMVGPFVFLDHMGPVLMPAGQGLDVRPHPHIGLATVTYLTEGSILHRDTLGTTQPILPGEVNWMTAGRGIAHSERTDAPVRQSPHAIHGIQSWVALPRAFEETDPGFVHHAVADLPAVEDRGVALRLIAGSMYGQRSPVKTFSETFYADVRLDAGGAVPLPTEHPERAAYLIDGALDIAGEVFEEHRLLVFRPGDAVTLRALRPSRVLLLGGEPMDGPRHVWWNFVSSSKDRIEAAKADWKAGRFGQVAGDAEFIPLPD